MPDQEHRGPGLLRIAHQPRRALAHLADRTGGGGEGFGPQGLHRVGDDQLGLHLDRVAEDRLDPGFRQRLQAVQRQPQAHRAPGHLGQRLLAGHVQRRKHRRHLRHGLQQQGGLADARIPAHQHDGAFHQPAAKYPVQLTDAGRHPCILRMTHVLERGDLRRIDLAGPAAAAGRRPRGLAGRHRRLHHELAQRVPGPALTALPLPFRMIRPALGAHIGNLGFGGGTRGFGSGLGHGNTGRWNTDTVAARRRTRGDPGLLLRFTLP